MKLFFQDQFRDESEQDVIGTLLRKGWQEAPSEPDLQPGELAQRDPESHVWNVISVPQPVAEWTSLEFYNRFNLDERIGFIEAARTDAFVEDFRLQCAAAGSVRSDNPITAQALTYLVSQNLLTAERAAEVLNPDWNPS